MANRRELIQQYIELGANNMAHILLLAPHEQGHLTDKDYDKAVAFVENHKRYDDLFDKEAAFHTAVNSSWAAEDVEQAIYFLKMILEGKVEEVAREIDKMENLKTLPEENPHNKLFAKMAGPGIRDAGFEIFDDLADAGYTTF